MYDNATSGDIIDTIGDLNEFTNYRFGLSANTSVGGGPAAVVMVTTDEDGRLITVYEGLIVILRYVVGFEGLVVILRWLSTLLKCTVKSEWVWLEY